MNQSPVQALRRALVAGPAQTAQLAVAHAAELARLQGHDADAQVGAIIIDACLGNAGVRLEFEVEPAQDGGRDDPSWDESVTLLGVLINGAWIGMEFFDGEVTDRWEQAALDYLQEQRDADEAQRAEFLEAA